MNLTATGVPKLGNVRKKLDDLAYSMGIERADREMISEMVSFKITHDDESYTLEVTDSKGNRRLIGRAYPGPPSEEVGALRPIPIM